MVSGDDHEHIFVGVGANVGKRFEALTGAVDMLAAHPLISVEAVSPVYESDPMYYADQRMVLNMVVSVRSELSSGELLDVLEDIERRLGRRPTFRNGPRVIDLDILYYGGLVRESGACILPHPLIHERKFALIPLADIAPDFEDPLRGKSVARLVEECPDVSELRRLSRTIRIPTPLVAPVA